MTTYVVTFSPGPSDVPIELRLRRLLKIALRSFSFTAVDIKELAESPGNAVNRPAPGKRVCVRPRPILSIPKKEP